jgi:hypothetical protein
MIVAICCAPQRFRAAAPMFSVAPHRLPTMRPCGLRQQQGTLNLRHTSSPRSFSASCTFNLVLDPIQLMV